jgi:hypothetical protein
MANQTTLSDESFGIGTSSNKSLSNESFGIGTSEPLSVMTSEEGYDMKAAEEHRSKLGGWLSGIDNAFVSNYAREGRALFGSETLMNNDWFFGKFHYGDKPWTPEEEKGFGWISVQEQMGVSPEEWDAMPHNERLKQLNDVSQKQIHDTYNPDVDTAAYQISRFLGYITDPTSLIALRGPTQFAAFGAADMSLWEHSTTGKLSPETPVIGAAGGYAIGKGIQMGKKFFANRKSRKSNKVVNAFNDEMNIIAAGSDGTLDITHIFQLAKKNLGFSDDVIDDAFARVSKKEGESLALGKGGITAPTKQTAIENIIKQSTEEVVMPGSGHQKYERGPKAFAESLGRGIDYFIEPVSEEIKRVSPRIFGKLHQISRSHFEDTHKYAMMVDPFLRRTLKSKKFSAVDKTKLQIKPWTPKIERGFEWTPADNTKLQLMMLNAKSGKDTSKIIKYLRSKGGKSLVDDYKLYRQAMEDIYKQRVKVGNDKLKKVIGYSPRKIIDFTAWYKGARKEELTAISRILKDKYKLTPEQAKSKPKILQDVISKYLAGKGGDKNIQIAGSAKPRTREIISEAQLPAYQDQWNATHKYIKESMEEVQRYKLFRPENIDVGGDVDKSIANYATAEHIAGRLNYADIGYLKKLLAARFINGPRQMNKYAGMTKDVGYMTLLGHPTNAIRQLGDLAFSQYENNTRNTLRGLWSTFNKGRYMSPKEMGLLDNVAEEFASDTVAKRGTDFAFKYSGFRAVDAMGKGTLANSTIHKFARDTISPKGRAAFMRKFGAYIGPEDAAKALDEFKAFKTGKIEKPTPLMKDVAFIKLARIQPVDLLQMPKGYLNHPNGRMAYMLKSFAIKHINVIRQDVFKEMRKGYGMRKKNPDQSLKHYGKAMKNLLVLGTYFTGVNMGADKLIDLAYGRKKTLEETFHTNLYRATGLLSKYDVDQMGRDGDVYSWAVALPVPPLDPMVEGVMEAIWISYNIATGKSWDANLPKGGGDVAPNIPILGRLMKAWLTEEL